MNLHWKNLSVVLIVGSFILSVYFSPSTGNQPTAEVFSVKPEELSLSPEGALLQELEHSNKTISDCLTHQGAKDINRIYFELYMTNNLIDDFLMKFGDQIIKDVIVNTLQIGLKSFLESRHEAIRKRSI